ncbi:MAG: glycogen debranching protein GlgX [Treponemataceae bacterium]|nr:MAG: glycogen debranching protein GlgX [Treponemataceae bacterium]
MKQLATQSGKPFPHGAELRSDGINFSLFSRNGKQVFLALFANENDDRPFQTIELNRAVNKTGDVWHVFVEGLGAGALYLYRIAGQSAADRGHRFNVKDYLLDPYAKAITGTKIFANLMSRIQPSAVPINGARALSAAGFPKCVVVDDSGFDWQGDRPLNIPLRDCIIYETHVKGISAHPSARTLAGVRHPGTYRGVIEMIPYFKELGITSLELLPVHEFDETETDRVNPATGKQLVNYWGYSTIAFFAPKASYASDAAPGACVAEFKEMVRELHKKGIEVILDVVFNHTAEGNENGVSINFRGIDNSVYYILDDRLKQYYKNFSGCGNTFNCNHPVARELILQCLRYWVLEMHVDGFRFDLAAILNRDRGGYLLAGPGLPEAIAEDPVLADTKIIAEAWDAGGAYMVGRFPGGRWAEWNDRYRDDIRRFWHGGDFTASAASTRIAGSADLYYSSARRPCHSINFVSCHDGFTLNDMVSYNGKHNEANGENNRDGSDNNISYNYGFEGDVKDKAIDGTRTRQIKNFFLTLMISQGTPMILGGDEIRRTQAGNNNAYCQDNEISWYDWTLKKENYEIYVFFRKAIAFRKKHPVFRRPDFFKGIDLNGDLIPDITWVDRAGKTPDWKTLNKYLAFFLAGNHMDIQNDTDDDDFFIMCNSDSKDIGAALPAPPAGKKWFRLIDTSVPAPEDFLDEGYEETLPQQRLYVLPARSMAVLVARTSRNAV